ncbi:hypothetical protein [Actinocrispum wychmicini]|uniref:DUF4157 domain-containing protein n=1 Tax=Actinocrispum wychmicini TaxID=1213861 RepID=A0A4R2JRF7_9PSEU|nr:hypothetical protein [Actinocrispum wychmicini]TCO62094.1 hypothetical protein EV192_102231 [Actinocrispum wychmicini]
MSRQSVDEIAHKYNIDIRSLNIKIDKNRDGVYGITAPNGDITLRRAAFRSEEQLARTLVHEKFHVQQIESGKGYPAEYDPGNSWEKEAQQYEDDWWERYGKYRQDMPS